MNYIYSYSNNADEISGQIPDQGYVRCYLFKNVPMKFIFCIRYILWLLFRKIPSKSKIKQ